MSQWIVRGVLVALGVIATAAVADALVLTDEERLEEFAEAVTHERADAVAALDWVDTARVSVDVVEGDARDEYEDDLELELRMQSLLDPLADPDARVVSKIIEVEGENATVALRLQTGAGVHDVQFGMVRRGDGWLVSRVRVL